MDAACEALTVAGTQCKRHGKARDPQGRWVCTQHLYGHHHIITITDVEPWTQRGMPTPAKALRPHVLQKLRRKLKAGPRPLTPRKGRGGSVYVYCLEDDDMPNLYKVGMTSDSVDKRLQSWARKHKDTVLKRVAEYVVTQDVAWVERVVHLYLDYCRVYRYPRVGGTGLYSVWAATGKPLNAEQQPSSPRSLLVTEKMIEWFSLPFDEIDALISQVH